MILGDKYDGKIVKTLEGMEWGVDLIKIHYTYMKYLNNGKICWFYETHKKIYFKAIFCCIYIIYHLLKTRGNFHANKIDILLGTIQKFNTKTH